MLLQALSLCSPDEYGSLTIVGDGTERLELENLANGLGVPARFVGKVDRTAVVDFLGRARLVVVPSVPRGTQQEASGLVPLEAQACGTPVVATRVGGLHENLPREHEDYGAEPGPEDLARAVRHALSEDFEVSSTRVRKHAVDEHSMQRVSREMGSLYARLLSRRQH
jgi:glycosyltransferase involved in cell wall biosynthesis